MDLLTEFKLGIGSENYSKIYVDCLRNHYEVYDINRDLYIQRLLKCISYGKYISNDIVLIKLRAIPIIDLVKKLARKCDSDLKILYLLYCLDKKGYMICIF